MAKDKFVIWSNENLNIDDWKDWFEEENLTSEDDQWAFINDLNYTYLEDERTNLKDIKADIIGIADLGLWNGRVGGYKDFKSVSECLSSECDYVTWFVNPDGDLCCSASHHDGSNFYIYRAWRKDVSDEIRQEVRDAIYFNSKNKDELIAKYTEPLGSAIAKVYGFVNVNDMFAA